MSSCKCWEKYLESVAALNNSRESTVEQKKKKKKNIPSLVRPETV